MYKHILVSVFMLILSFALYSQNCSVTQSLTVDQEIKLKAIMSSLDSALNAENLTKIDSVSELMKSIYGSQAGLPDGNESFYNLITLSTPLGVSDFNNLARALIRKDSLIYVDLWKMAKGMKPPTYQSNSIFLRSSAEIASGLMKIAKNEPDLNRKSLYELWATNTLDSLATMQLPSGAFPFPDLRKYGDQTFSSIIQNFLNKCGSDSVLVLQNGWIIDDKNSGEFKFDAGVISNAYYEAYLNTGKLQYKNIVIAIGNYLKPLKFNLNYNYNTFSSLALTRAFQVTNDSSFLKRAIKTLRYSVYPGQIKSGRWVDGHNANAKYHSIIIQNLIPTILLMPKDDESKNKLDMMAISAIRNLTESSFTCGSSTGYRWLLSSGSLYSTLIPQSLKDSMLELTQRYINQSAINGKYLDVPTLGQCVENIELISGVQNISYLKEKGLIVFQDPTNNNINIIFNNPCNDNVNISIFDLNGKLMKCLFSQRIITGTYNIRSDLSAIQSGVYIILVRNSKNKIAQKICITN